MYSLILNLKMLAAKAMLFIDIDCLIAEHLAQTWRKPNIVLLAWMTETK